MPAPLAIIGLGSLLASAAGLIGRFLLLTLTSILGQLVITAIIFVTLNIFFSAQIAGAEWAIEKAVEFYNDVTGGTIEYVFPLGGVVDALRIIDCMVVLFNAYFSGMLIKLLKPAIGLLSRLPATPAS